MSAPNDKMTRLLEYLLRVSSLRSAPCRDIDNYGSTKIIWLSDIPQRQNCFCRAWGADGGHDEWIRIRSQKEPTCPPIPQECSAWIEIDALNNKLEIPTLCEEVLRPPKKQNNLITDKSQILVEYKDVLDNHPEVKAKWDEYIQNCWKPWAKEHDEWAAAHKVYLKLFSIRQEQIRQGEQYELVLGIGLLNWSPEGSGYKVHRHLIVANALLEFDAENGEFIIKAHQDGAKLRPEMDMLDINDQPVQAEADAKTDLLQAGDDPWDNDCVESVLRSLVHSISPNGEYSDNLASIRSKGTAAPLVEYAPALFLRPYSTKGLTEGLNEIKRIVQDDEAVGKIPAGFLDLAEVPTQSLSNVSNQNDSTSGDNGSALYEELYFPKPFNDEQQRIIKKFKDNACNGVLVQGPPGTGKSHTIANLICHLLATGQRILVTAMTPRALQVLERLLPPDLRPLCINLLGSGAEERNALESSINGILEKSETWNEAKNHKEQKELEATLHQLRQKLAEQQRRILSIRESETVSKTIGCGMYKGTAANIVRKMNENREKYQWFSDNVNLDGHCPVSSILLREAHEYFQALTPQWEKESLFDLPELHIDQNSFATLVENENLAKKEVDKHQSNSDVVMTKALIAMPQDRVSELSDWLESYKNILFNLPTDSLVGQILPQILSADYSEYIEISSRTKKILNNIELADDILDGTTLEIPDNYNLNTLLTEICKWHKSLSSGTKLSWSKDSDTALVNHLSNFEQADLEEFSKVLSGIDAGWKNVPHPAWTNDVIHSVIAGQAGFWSDLLNFSKQEISKAYNSNLPLLSSVQIEVPNNTPASQLLNSAHTIMDHLQAGGKLKWTIFLPTHLKEALRIVKDVRLNNHRCASYEDLSTLVAWLQLEHQTNQLIQNWGGRIPKQPSLAQQWSLFYESVQTLEKIMHWSHQVAKGINSLQQFGLPNYPICDTQGISTLIASCRLALSRNRYRLKCPTHASHVIFSMKINNHWLGAANDFQIAAKVIKARLLLNEAWSYWNGLGVTTPIGPYSLQISKLKHITNILDTVLTIAEPVENIYRILRACSGLENIDHVISPSFFDTVISSFEQALAKRNEENIKVKLNELETTLEGYAHNNNVHNLVKQLLRSCRDRDVANFNTILTSIEALANKRQKMFDLKKSAMHLSSIFPKLAQLLSETIDESFWPERIENIDEAWAWAQARYWVEDYLRQDEAPALTQSIKQIEKNISGTLAKMASAKAWSSCCSHLTENHRRHMKAWQQAMKSIGKGTGKYVQRHRQIAQQELNHCRDAVPSWVMPLHRIWDTIKPEPGMFDAIIIDEASQCGLDALPLLFLGKKTLIVGDDKQISPEVVGVDKSSVYALQNHFLSDFEFKHIFDIEKSLFDQGALRYSSSQITLREHFRCMPEIISFSNRLCYLDKPLIPLRQYGSDRLEPLIHVFLENGYCDGSDSRVINRPEAEAIANKIAEMCQNERYHNKTMGVITLQGNAQSSVIEELLLNAIGAEEYEKRRIICGNPYSFQGDERDIIFLSMVAAPNRKIGAMTKDTYERSFNVAASRARDQLLLYHSVRREDLSQFCLRRKLIEFFEDPEFSDPSCLNKDDLEMHVFQTKRKDVVDAPPPFDSWFEVDVALDLLRKGYKVMAQVETAGRRIDLVVVGGQLRLAVECDGDHWHGADSYVKDMERQRQLERCGWEFFRIRESEYYASKDSVMDRLTKTLDSKGIRCNI